ncbi:mannitol transporter, putative [Ectocarpus siliculosus]|uniref:Hexose transporter 1 n=1 Tax=Ectocarpus siliculosus TaxID=2880 RepID=D8LRZ1_ECTSI|nr:mannitol transporter, putative [Ectocarpus siliculosus]|eukprot:CBN73775.1 mannitol transporter, putative [Ectocarpus siliculosus]
MRPVGATTVDSSVMDVAADSVGDGAAAAAAGVEMVENDRDGVEEFYGEGEVSSQCCGRLSPTAVVYMSAFVSSLTSVLLGYDVGVISGAIKYIQEDFGLSTLQKGVIVSSLNLVAAGGGLVAGSVSDTLGRKRSIAAACLVFITGSIIKIAAQSFGVLLLGRIVTGIGVGCGFVVAPVYIAEITPPHIRGRLTSLTGGKWRTMLGISIVPPFIILSSLCLLPESPRWLLGKGREVEAFAVLCTIVPTGDAAKRELAEMKTIAGEEDSAKSSWSELVCTTSPALKSTVLLGLGLGIAQQASGSEAAVYYSPSVLSDAGLTSDSAELGGNILVGLFKLGGEVFAYFLVDRTGRRPLFIASSSLVTFFLIFLSVTFSAAAPAWMTLSGLCLFMWSFSLGMGALTFLVAAEIFPLRYRGRGVSLTVCVNRLTSGLVALAFPLLERRFTAGGTFFLFSIFSVGTVWFYYTKIPETKDRTLEEISAGAAKETSEGDTATALGLAPTAEPGTVDSL